MTAQLLVLSILQEKIILQLCNVQLVAIETMSNDF